MSTPAERLDEDVFGRVVAERDAGAIDLAENGAVARDLADERGLAETHFTDALAELGVAGETTNAAEPASGELTKRQERRRCWWGLGQDEDE